MTEFKLGAAYTDQGRRVAEHWSRLAVTYEGAIRALQKKGISLTRLLSTTSTPSTCSTWADLRRPTNSPRWRI